jgi:hypothetical protein
MFQLKLTMQLTDLMVLTDLVMFFLYRNNHIDFHKF